MGEICRNPAPVPVVATSDHPLLGGSGESRLKNPLRKICTAGSVRGENKMSHGRPKRARSWKRRIEPRKAYSLWRSPLLLLWSLRGYDRKGAPIRISGLRCLALASRALQGGSGALAYATYLGGDGADIIHAMAIDASNNVYLTGETSSSNFPVTAGAFQKTRRPACNYHRRLSGHFRGAGCLTCD